MMFLRPRHVPESHDKLLNAELTACQTAEDIARVVLRQGEQELSPTNVVCALARLARLARGQHAGAAAVSHALDALEGHVAERAGRYRPRDTASAAYSLAQLGRRGGRAMRALSAAALPQLAVISPRHLARLLLAAGDHQLLMHGAPQVMSRMSALTASELVMLLGAYSQADKALPPTLLSRLGSALLPLLGQLRPIELTAAVGAMAAARHTQFEGMEALLDGIAARAARVMGRFRPAELARLLGGLAALDHRSPGLFALAAGPAVQMLRHFRPTELVALLGAYAHLRHRAPALFEVAAPVALAGLAAGEGNALAELLTACGDTRHTPPSLLLSFSQRIAQDAAAGGGTLAGSGPRAAARAACTFATTGHYNMAAMGALARTTAHALRVDFDASDPDADLPAATVSLLWACATLRHEEPGLGALAAHRLAACMERLSPLDVSTAAWALAVLHGDDDGAYVEAFLAAARDAVLASPGAFAPRMLCRLLWSHAVFDALPDSETLSRLSAPLLGECKLSTEDYCQIYQTALMRGLRAPSSADDGLPTALREAAKRHWEDAAALVTPSDFHLEVYSALLRLGLECELEWRSPNGAFFVDIMLRLPCGEELLLEVDGPRHFSASIPHKPLGSTCLRRRLVTALTGQQVLSVPFFEWNGVGSSAREKERYLLAKLGINSAHSADIVFANELGDVR